MTATIVSRRLPRSPVTALAAMLPAALLLAAMLLAAIFCAATATAQYTLPRSVFGCGGTAIAGADNRIAGTLGQTVAGIASASVERNYIGFWWTLTPIAIGVEHAPDAPESPELAQNYPNPFREQTTVTFRIGARVPVRLSILDMLGRERAVLVDGILDPGSYSARFGVHDPAAPSGAQTGFSPGMYVIRLVAGAELRSVSCVLLR
jgi:hypothetical protein